MINLDFETFSEIDIKKCGAHRYASDPSTELLSISWQTPYMSEPELWVPGDKMPKYFKKAVSHRLTWSAFNAEFEMVIWHHVCHLKMGWGACPDESHWIDTAAVARYYALPGSLDKCAEALHSPFPKDDAGHRIMLKLSRPRKPSATNPDRRWWPSTKSSDFDRLYEYNKQDVRAERWIGNKLGELPEPEQHIWEMNIRLNRRGTPVDLDMARTIVEIKDHHLEACNEKITELTSGAITKTTQTARIAEYIGAPSLARDYLESILPALDGENRRQVAELRLQGARSSTAKFEAMLLGAIKARLHGMYLYHSASTGRFSASMVQPHNLPRPKLNEHEIALAIKILKSRMSLRDKYNRLCKIGDIMTVFASLIRAGVKAKEGYVFSVMDFSSIEARVLAWLANELAALALYRKGEDPYVHMAAYVYKVNVKDVTKDQRALGKAIILGAGYSMSAVTFRATCDSWGIPISEELAEEAIKAYREKHPAIKSFWYALNTTCIEAIKSGKRVRCGHIVAEPVLHPFRALRLTLPNGKYLHYPYAYVKVIQAPWDPDLLGNTYYYNNHKVYDSKPDKNGDCHPITYDRDRFKIDSIFYKKLNSTTYQWRTENTYGGKLVENVTQAVARELLCEAMIKMEKAGLPLFIHVHDEAGAEVRKSTGEKASKLMHAIMRKAPKWCKTLPLEAEGWVGERYKK